MPSPSVSIAPPSSTISASIVLILRYLLNSTAKALSLSHGKYEPSFKPPQALKRQFIAINSSAILTNEGPISRVQISSYSNGMTLILCKNILLLSSP